MGTLIVLLILSVLVILAIRNTLKKGSCGDCSSGTCHSCKVHDLKHSLKEAKKSF